MANDIHELRDLLFGSIRALKAGQMDPEQARAISDLTGRIIDTAKVEVEVCKLIGAKSVGFLGTSAPVPVIEEKPTRPTLEAVRTAPSASLGLAAAK